MSKKKIALLFMLAGLTCAGEARAQAPSPGAPSAAPPPYGAPVGIEDAK